MIQEPAASLFINREQSWLAFNERVLAEARDSSTPLLERLKFAAIAASNLDEFFMVRVAALRHANETGETAVDMAGLSPSEQFTISTVCSSPISCRRSRVSRYSCCRGGIWNPSSSD
jgi:polyphosphate kinase